MNSVNLIGRACAQPTLRYTQSNRPVAEFTLAVEDPFNKDPQTNKPRSYFFFIVIWGTKAEVAHQYISKGQRIGITGRLTQEQYTPKDSDKPVTKTRINAESFDLLEKPQGHQPTDSSWRPPANGSSAPPDQPPAEEDHIPF